jgi:hypothetical protein
MRGASVGYIMLSKPGSSITESTSLDGRQIWQQLFPSASSGGVELDDLPKSIPAILNFIRRPQNENAYRLVSSRGINARINYDLLAEEFNQTYWLRNYIKCLLLSRFARSEIEAQSDFLDIGGGIGPFGLAVLDVSNNASITIHDSSRMQERIFKEIKRRELVSQQIRFFRHKVNLKFLSLTKTARLFSYVLCENQDLISSPARILDVIGDMAVLLDYWQIVELVADAALAAGHRVNLLERIEVPLGVRLARIVGQDAITVSGGVFQR